MVIILFQVREIYSKCAIENITSTQAFRECMQLINFQSQYKLVESIKDALKVVNDSLQITSPIKTLRSTPVKNDQFDVSINNAVGETLMKTMRIHLMMFLRQIENANNQAAVLTDYDGDDVEIKTEVPGDRYKLKEVCNYLTAILRDVKKLVKPSVWISLAKFKVKDFLRNLLLQLNI